MGDSNEDPGRGDPAAIGRMAAARSGYADQVRRAARSVSRSVASLSSAQWSGKARAAFDDTVSGRVRPQLTEVAKALDAQAEALSRYASAVSGIKDEAEVVRRLQRDSAERTVMLEARVVLEWPVAQLEDVIGGDDAPARALSRLQGQLEEERSRSRGLAVRWQALVRRRERADRACVAAMRDRSVLGATAVFASGHVTSASALLKRLSGLSAYDVRAVLAGRPHLAHVLSTASASQVAAWWSGMDSGESDPSRGVYVASAVQEALIAAIPAVIGNLNGVAYWARDRANQAVLAAAIPRARARVKALKAAAGSPGEFSWASPTAAAITATSLAADYNKAKEQLTALMNTRTAVGHGLAGNPPHELVSLDVSADPPLAAVASGDLDRASHISYIVPGMNTSVAKDVRSYTGAADSMRLEQYRVGNVSLSSVATVAWLGYHPPTNASFPTVAGDGKAQVGAASLAAGLAGVHATHAASGRPMEVSVIAHSYGTDVATLALLKGHADHAVLLGSAGVDSGITAHDLHVPDGQVFASQAVHDGWAPVGQFVSPGREDPTRVGFGAHDFSSEASVVGHVHLQAVTQHGPLVHASDPSGYSYLDANTTAQFNTARATMGLGSAVPVGDTPAQRSASGVGRQLYEQGAAGRRW